MIARRNRFVSISGRTQVTSQSFAAAGWCLSTAKRMRGRQIIPNSYRRHSTFSHRMTELVEPQDDVTRSIKTRNIGSLIFVDDETAFLRNFGAEPNRKR